MNKVENLKIRLPPEYECTDTRIQYLQAKIPTPWKVQKDREGECIYFNPRTYEKTRNIPECNSNGACQIMGGSRRLNKRKSRKSRKSRKTRKSKTIKRRS